MKLINSTIEAPTCANTREALLWMACIERAVVDWRRGMKTVSYSQYHGNYPLAAGQKELKLLRWFFFSKVAYPHNLQWIAEHVFHADGYAEGVRKKLGPLAEWWDYFK